MKKVKRCPRCEETLRWQEFGKNAARSDGLNPYCTPCRYVISKELEQKWRAAALDALGSACAHCGIDDRRVLCIDHIAGGGTKMRKSGLKQTTFYRLVAIEPAGYQALCWNCNWIKRLECDGREITELSLTA